MDCHLISYSLLHATLTCNVMRNIYFLDLSHRSYADKIKSIALRILLSPLVIAIALVDIPIGFVRTIVRLFQCKLTCQQVTEVPRHILILFLALPLLIGYSCLKLPNNPPNLSPSPINNGHPSIPQQATSSLSPTIPPYIAHNLTYLSLSHNPLYIAHNLT